MHESHYFVDIVTAETMKRINKYDHRYNMLICLPHSVVFAFSWPAFVCVLITIKI